MLWSCGLSFSPEAFNICCVVHSRVRTHSIASFRRVEVPNSRVLALDLPTCEVTVVIEQTML